MRRGASPTAKRSTSSCSRPMRSSELAAGGYVDPESRTDLARSGVAIAVAAGAPRPDVGTEAAIRDAVLRARSIGYSTGPSGAHIVRLFERWGIAELIASRIVAGAARRSRGHAGGARRCRAGLPAAERIDARAGHRRRRPACRRKSKWPRYFPQRHAPYRSAAQPPMRCSPSLLHRTPTPRNAATAWSPHEPSRKCDMASDAMR